MHQELWEPTPTEKKALFGIFLMGEKEAQQGRPLRKGHNLSTAEQRIYERGYISGMGLGSVGVSENHQPW